jgi:valyl-tRNA synthetase
LVRFECRKKLWADMKDAGQVIKEEAFKMNVPRYSEAWKLLNDGFNPMVCAHEPLADMLGSRPGWQNYNIPNISLKSITTGWKTLRLVCQPHLWGDIEFQSGTVRIAVNERFPELTLKSVPNAAARMLNKADVLDTWFSSCSGHFQQ